MSSTSTGPQFRLAIEIDGVTHDNKEAVVYDVQRQGEIEQLGIRFLRFSNEQVYRKLPDVVATIGAAVKDLGRASNPLCPSDISPSEKGRETSASF